MIKRFFKTLQNSLYSPEFYKKQLDEPIGPAFRFYFIFILLLSIVQILLTLPVFFNVQADLKQTANQVVSSYPKDLDVTIKNGVVSTTAQEPYVIALPPSQASAKQPKNALVIDTKTPYSSTQFDAYNTLSWVTKDTMYYEDGQGQIKSVDLHQISNLHVNKPILTSIWQKTQPYMVWVAPGLALLLFIGFLLGGVLRLGYLLLLAAIIILFGKIAKKQLRFKQSYTILLYAVTLPLIVTSIIGVLATLNLFHGIVFSFTLLTFLSVIVNLFPPSKKKTGTS